jgi:hypothetical protein
MFDKGRITIDHNITFDFNAAKIFNIDSKIGYFFIPNLETNIGISAFANNSYSYADLTTSIQYYFMPDERTAFYPSILLDISLDESASGTHYFGGGFNHFLNRNIALDVSYYHNNIRSPTSNSPIANHNINIGLKYFIK